MVPITFPLMENGGTLNISAWLDNGISNQPVNVVYCILLGQRNPRSLSKGSSKTVSKQPSRSSYLLPHCTDRYHKKRGESTTSSTMYNHAREQTGGGRLRVSWDLRAYCTPHLTVSISPSLKLYFCSWFWIKDAVEPRWLY